jgi:FAD synthetase
MTPKNILAFGTFDGIHSGHEFFLRSAKSRGTYLVAAVARDQHVKDLKDKKPANNEQKRLKAVVGLSYVDEAVLSDEVLGSFDILRAVNPDMIVLGHDQLDLEQGLLTWMGEEDHYIPMLKIKKI